MKEELKFGKKLYYLMSLKVAVPNNGGKGKERDAMCLLSSSVCQCKSDCHYRIYIQMSRVVTDQVLNNLLKSHKLFIQTIRRRLVDIYHLTQGPTRQQN